MAPANRKTHCPHGHPYSGSNLLIRVDSAGHKRRGCRACKREGDRRHRQTLPKKPPYVPPPRAPAWDIGVHERFFSKVRKLPLAAEVRSRLGPCWVWTGRKSADGYGLLRIGKKWWRAHRVSWLLHGNAIPPGTLITHRCDNRACVRRSHLRLGTHRMNMDEAIARHRIPRGSLLPHTNPPGPFLTRYYDQSHTCRRGHHRTPKTTRWRWRVRYRGPQRGWSRRWEPTCLLCKSLTAAKPDRKARWNAARQARRRTRSKKAAA